MNTAMLLAAAIEECARARTLFPQPNNTTLALAEEAGEVVKAALDFRQGKSTRHDLRKELKQTIAMCLRLAEEGDPTIGVPPCVDAAPPASTGERGGDARLAALEEVAALARRFVREDPDAPGCVSWGHHIDDEGGDLGMDPDTFALEMDAALSRVEAASPPPRSSGTSEEPPRG